MVGWLKVVGVSRGGRGKGGYWEVRVSPCALSECVHRQTVSHS